MNNTEYHRANFIYLTKINYFENIFHRVVKGFIIQGGNSDNINISKKRKKLAVIFFLPMSIKAIIIIGSNFNAQQ